MDTKNRLLRLAAHCLFDGWILKPINLQYRLGYANKSEILINQFTDDAKVFIGKLPYTRKRRTATEIEISNKKLFFQILEYINLDKTIKKEFFNQMKLNKNLIKLFLRAFWDDEGTVGFYGKTRKLRGRCSNDKLRKQILELHKIFGVPVREDYDKLGIIITGKENLRKFKEKINFTPGIKVLRGNGISIVWKGHDKCVVLNSMLDAYCK